MKFSRGSRSLGMVLVGLVLLPVLVLAMVHTCHADGGHRCDGNCTHSECCGGHSMPLLAVANPVPIVRHSVSPYHAIEEQPTLRIFASSIFRPPRA
ncbi:MAG: hypothetical protein WCD80_08540 [Desulfobaccales bacterium]